MRCPGERSREISSSFFTVSDKQNETTGIQYSLKNQDGLLGKLAEASKGAKVSSLRSLSMVTG